MDEEDHPTGMKYNDCIGIWCELVKEMLDFIHGDASYLSVTKARSRANGFFLLSDPKPDAITFSEYTPILSGFIFIMCKYLRNIMASAAEA